jgi:succinate-semialdehyde dehydrogenase/glutarate-semialdehyde dehydrogenase
MTTSPLNSLSDPTLLKTDGLIDGQWVSGSDRFAVHDPATGGHLGDVANLDAEHAQAAGQHAANLRSVDKA